MRVEMVLPTLAAAGMEMVVATLARGLHARGYDVGITCTEAEGPLVPGLRADGIPVRVVPVPGKRTILRPTPLVRWFRERRPDVVHVHSGIWLKAARAARLAGVPRVVHTAHGVFGDEPWHDALLKRWAARYTHENVAVSEPLRRYYAEHFGIPAARTRVILNGIDTRRFSPGPRSGALRAAPILGDRPLVGLVARFHPVKNHPLLLEAFAVARRRVPDARLVLVGDGEERPTIERRIAELGIGDAVHLAGARADLPAVYRDLDLFVLSSDLEGTSISLLEALSSGVCSIATAVGGNPDLLDGGRCGALVPARDPAAMGEAIATLLLDGERRRSLGAAGRAHVERTYGLDAMLDGYIRLYQRTEPAGIAVGAPVRA